jgi:PIN domain nuclease of toxin-antitoxin system
MRLMLDSHVVIWALTLPHLIPEHIRQLIEDGENEVHVSVASFWELAIKSSLGRRSAPAVDPRDLLKMCVATEFAVLPITPDHTMAVMTLPHLHTDPFDRIIVAQAKTEPLRLITRDKMVAAYDPNFISW